MNIKLKVKGMHCAACEALITMELQEAGIADKVQGLALADNNTGVLKLHDCNEEDIKLVKSIINNMDSYSID